jgi:heme oxygenase (biliverdin-IX-beta and delta-forming)
VLSTMSVDVPEYPFGSVTPYCADSEGRPIIYISTIAQHTKNILANSKVSLTVVENGIGSDDVQTRGRVTCIGDARSLKADDAKAAGERYFRYFPSAQQYEGTHDFEFFRLDLVRVRYIGGFGQIYWVEPQEFIKKNPFSRAQELRIVQHMNQDHRDALKGYAGTEAVMVGIDSEGFDLRTAESKRRIPFEAPVSSMEEAREALIAMARRVQG